MLFNSCQYCLGWTVWQQFISTFTSAFWCSKWFLESFYAAQGWIYVQKNLKLSILKFGVFWNFEYQYFWNGLIDSDNDINIFQICRYIDYRYKYSIFHPQIRRKNTKIGWKQAKRSDFAPILHHYHINIFMIPLSIFLKDFLSISIFFRIALSISIFSRIALSISIF